jgi:hypothetical protein
MRISRLLLIGIASTLIAWCGVITETETNGNASNNTIATAQAIPDSAFTDPTPPGIFDSTLSAATIQGLGGGQDVDFYSFTGNGALEISISDTPFTFPTIVSLFDSTGALLAYDDTSDPVRPGSVSTNDSYIGAFTLPNPGTYYVAVGSANGSVPSYPDTSSCTSFDVLTRQDGGFGGITTTGCNSSSSVFAFAGAQPSDSLSYTLVIAQAAQATPEPGTLGLLTLGAGALVIAKRRFAVRSQKQQEVR